ncbi:MAG: hypothetical protein WBW79_05200 [Desulfocapsaceae bacterium]
MSQYGRGSRLEVVEEVGHMSILQISGAQILVKEITANYDAQQGAAADAAAQRG